MLDHIGIAVSDSARSGAFYDAALRPLGITLIVEIPGDRSEASVFGYGRDGEPFFWFGEEETIGEGLHVAFAAATRDEVDAFYRAALAAGASDNGAPGLRPQYGANYYAAFVRDPDGHNIEAVCRSS